MIRSIALLRLSLGALAVGIALSTSCAAPRNSAAPAIAAPPAHVTGIVVTPDGKPVAGALVIYCGEDLTTGKADPTQTSKTDPRGKFDIEAHGNSANQVTTLYASSSDGVAILSGAETPLMLTLSPFTQVTLRFVDAQGKPVAGISVAPFLFTLGKKLAATWSGDISNRWTKTTDANGDVTLSNLPQGYTMTVDVKDENYAMQHTRIVLAKGPQTPNQTIHLELGGAVMGAVTYKPAGEPAPGVPVMVVQAGAQSSESVHTDAQGRYRLARLAPGTYMVQAMLAGDDANQSNSQRSTAVVTPGKQTAGPNFSLSPGGVIKGIVTDKASGKPLADIGVTVYQTGSPDRMTHEIGSDGRYSWRLKPGAWFIYPNSLGTQDIQPQKVSLAEGDAKTVNFEMKGSAEP